jgi:hypothetical protein
MIELSFHLTVWQLPMSQEIESVMAASVARASKLRQSVLKSAFEGKLA